jgi:hypothetical protein
MSSTCTTLAGTWRGVVLSRMVSADPGDQGVVEAALPQLDEEHHPHVGVSPGGHCWPITRDSTTSELLHLAVDLGRADAHAARVEGRVGAAVDDRRRGR